LAICGRAAHRSFNDATANRSSEKIMADRNHIPRDLILTNGVVVKGRLLVNQMTLRERRNYLSEGVTSNFSETDARSANYPEDEIAREFHKEKR
jgi:hypothetical protein